MRFDRGSNRGLGGVCRLYYLTFWGTDFTVNASTDCPAEDKATVQITLDASQAAVMDVFGFFNGKTLSAEVSMRKEDDCA